jgi:biopolymer transport protein ExbD
MPGAASSNSLRIAIRNDGAVYLDSTRIALEDMAPKVKDRVAGNPTAMVYVWADRRTSSEPFLYVLDELRAAGVSQVGLITEQQGQHDSQETTGNSTPMGEEVLPLFPPPAAAGRPPEQYREAVFDHGRLIAPDIIPKGRGAVCGAGFPIFLIVEKEHVEKGLKLCSEDTTWEELPGRLRELMPERSQGKQGARAIFVVARDVNLGYVAKAIDIAHSAGAEKVGLFSPGAEAGM